jgi:chromosome segregation ATPase
MKLTSALEVEIICLESAAESARLHTARMRRRLREAEACLADAEQAEETMRLQLGNLREALVLHYRQKRVDERC